MAKKTVKGMPLKAILGLVKSPDAPIPLKKYWAKKLKKVI